MNFDNLIIWAVTDGSQGMRSQVMGLSNQISKNIIEIKTELFFPWDKLQPGILPTYKWIFRNKIPWNKKPDIIISCGRRSVYFSLYCKKKFKKLFTIHIQNPKIPPKYFNYVISPNHDNFKGTNIINSVGALHHFIVESQKSVPGLVSCIVGGNNKHYHFNSKEANDLCDKLIELKKNNQKINLNIITSRRTSDLVKKILIKKLKNISSIWTGEGRNPYEKTIKSSSFFIVTSDSTSMISEASISGKPIYVYHLPLKRKSRRILNFHDEFSKLGITRQLKNINQLENWQYKLLNESERIASIIKKRIIEENI